MSADPWRRIEEIFHVALSLTGGEREAFLNSACGADSTLRQRLERRILEAQSSQSAALTASDATSTPERPSEGTSNFAGRRLGAFELESKLGSGGMGEVYRARDTRLHRHVAIKLLRTSESDGEGVRRRLLREARAAAALDHPNICPIYEIGDADGLSFIVMAYVDGETLSQTIAAQRHADGAIGTPDGAIRILLQIAAALAEAHKRGIVHRDIKPANVMLTPRGAVKVLDFGLAALTAAAGGEDPPDAPTVVNSTMAPGILAGTVPYMSPEQIRGERWIRAQTSSASESSPTSC
jgi:eukaryotic-like serine/threonine-protein kinase